MNRKERIDKLLQHNKQEMEGLRDEAMDEIRLAEREAGKRATRYGEAIEELAEVEAEILAATAEREAIPDRATRAGMDEDYELEDQLKERYKNLRHALEAWEDRRGSLKKEIARILPNPRGHALDSTIQEAESISRVAGVARKDMEHLKKELEKASADFVDPVVKEQESRKGVVESYTYQREYDLSPAGRGVVGPPGRTTDWSKVPHTVPPQ